MPTESTFLLAGLLFLAAALGYVFARFGDEDEGEEPQNRSETRNALLRGFRYLLNDESDRAVESLTEAAAGSDDIVEVQLALGALFRRRGELERAIRLHESLLERTGSTPEQREAALHALAEDFLGAGLFDRAEALFQQLRTSGRYGLEARQRLIRIAEVAGEWRKALELAEEIAEVKPESVQPAQLAHYRLELAEVARRDGHPAEAEAAVAAAERAAPKLARIPLLKADLNFDAGRLSVALDELGALAARNPREIGEVIARALTWGTDAASAKPVGEFLELLAREPVGRRALALGLLRHKGEASDTVLAALASFVVEHAELRGLVGSDGFGTPGTPAWRERVTRIRDVLRTLSRGSAAYRCGVCGYSSLRLQWQCPGCRSWDSIAAVDPPALSGP